MTEDQKKVLANGCIGITELALGRTYDDGPPPLDLSFSTFDKALSIAKGIEKQIKMGSKEYPANASVIVFSVRFWSQDPNKFQPDKFGKVDMSGYNYAARPWDNSGGYIPFDYGLYEKGKNTWLHANQSQSSPGGMTVFRSTLKDFSIPLMNFNRQVFSVAVTTEPQ